MNRASLVALVICSACSVQPSSSFAQTEDLTALGARNDVVALVDGTTLRTLTGDGTLVWERALTDGVPLDVVVGDAAVVSVEATLERRRLIFHPFDGSAPVALERDFTQVAPYAGGFVEVVARIEAVMGDRARFQLELVERDAVGAVRRRRPLTVDRALEHPLSKLLPVPVLRAFAVEGQRALYAWDSSGLCGGVAEVLELDLERATARVVWEGQRAQFDGCTCREVEGNVSDTVDGVAFFEGEPLVLARALPCAALAGGTSFTVFRGQRVANEGWTTGLVSNGTRLLARRGPQVVEWNGARFDPLVTVARPTPRSSDDAVDPNCRGVAMLGEGTVLVGGQRSVDRQP